MKNYKVKFKKVMENEITISAKDRQELSNKIIELYKESNFKDKNISNQTKHYYLIEVDNEIIHKESVEVI